MAVDQSLGNRSYCRYSKIEELGAFAGAKVVKDGGVARKDHGLLHRGLKKKLWLGVWLSGDHREAPGKSQVSCASGCSCLGDQQLLLFFHCPGFSEEPLLAKINLKPMKEGSLETRSCPCKANLAGRGSKESPRQPVRMVCGSQQVVWSLTTWVQVLLPPLLRYRT